ncbi:MAG: CRISPR-associated endonuclease Cas1 [Candidatus ainarchaeum sp.]|nr:CRISPR-associated endonuclease Cas1 [Candidatus ainarchaeum sp.]
MGDGQKAIAGEQPDLLPVRMLNEFVYCPRLFYIEFVEGEFEESADTLDGSFRHKRVDKETGEMPSAEEAESLERFHARSVLLSGEECGLVAKIDVVEGEGSKASPVDYKRGMKPGIPEGAWLADRVQLCAQGLILRENGFECDSGIVYYAGSTARVEVKLTQELIEKTLEFARKAKETATGKEIPPPLEDSPKCPRCSLVGICLPDETNQLSGRLAKEPRRIVPSLDEALPLYVQEQGAAVTKCGNELVIKLKGTVISRVRLIDVSQLSVFGNVQVTTQALRELCDRNIPLCHFSHGGWFYAITHGMAHKNVELRRKQFALSDSPDGSMRLARAFINGKIRNCRTLLRRNNPAASSEALNGLSGCAEQALNAITSEELLGIEGNAARIYFMHFGEMLKAGKGVASFDFQGRNRRPPRDPVNALLSYAYSLMAKDFTVTLLATGFDPYLGFFHAPKYGKPALSLDLMEEFRPLIGDSTVLTLINNDSIRLEDFVERAGAVALKPGARKKVIQAYERRMEMRITHPTFKYSLNYRRVIEVQARLLSRFLCGELPNYPAFCTR